MKKIIIAIFVLGLNISAIFAADQSDLLKRKGTFGLVTILSGIPQVGFGLGYEGSFVIYTGEIPWLTKMNQDMAGNSAPTKVTNYTVQNYMSINYTPYTQGNLMTQAYAFEFIDKIAFGHFAEDLRSRTYAYTEGGIGMRSNSDYHDIGSYFKGTDNLVYRIGGGAGFELFVSPESSFAFEFGGGLRITPYGDGKDAYGFFRVGHRFWL